MSEVGRQQNHGSESPASGAASGHVLFPESFERLSEFVEPHSHIRTRYAVVYPISTRRYAVQEDAVVFASGLDEMQIVQWLIERIGITTGRGTRRYVVVLDLRGRIAWRAPYTDAIEFLHAANPS